MWSRWAVSFCTTLKKDCVKNTYQLQLKCSVWYIDKLQRTIGFEKKPQHLIGYVSEPFPKFVQCFTERSIHVANNIFGAPIVTWNGTFVVDHHLPWPCTTEIIPIELFYIIARIYLSIFPNSFLAFTFDRARRVDYVCFGTSSAKKHLGVYGEVSRRRCKKMVLAFALNRSSALFINSNTFSAVDKRTIGGNKSETKWLVLILNFLSGECNRFTADLTNVKNVCDVNA